MSLTPTLLLILDGWGLAPAGSGNAPSVAKTPIMDALFQEAAHSELQASGRAVGLPEGYIGNSEVGHLNIGAGSIVYQDMTRIDMAMEQGELRTNPVFKELLQKTKAAGGRLHLAGLVSDGGVHSHCNHLKALTRIAVEAGLCVYLHCFMDGRDTPPRSGIDYVKDLEAFLVELQRGNSGGGSACIGSVCGRFYAMDRDTRWERVAEAWNMLVHGQGNATQGAPLLASQYLQASYDAGLGDEFVKPTLVEPRATWQDNDGIFFFNFRADRMREMVQALTFNEFEGFERGSVPTLSACASMTAYDSKFTLPVAFPKESLQWGLGEVVSSWGCKQLRLAETEKYAHVTYFFNGGREQAFEGEDRILVPSPRDVATYDLAPAMSCHEVTDHCVKALQSGEYTLIVCNLANGDMVGHTGILPAAIEACEAVDGCVGRMVEAVRSIKGRLCLIADHGNCEVMVDSDGGPQTAHTTNPVPCILLQEGEPPRLENGVLADVAPTLIALWGKEKPASMQGKNLAGACV